LPLLREVGGRLREVGRAQVLRRRVDEVTRQPRRAREGFAAGGALGNLAAAPRVAFDDPQLLDDAVGLLLLVALERVGAEERALDDRLRALPGRQAVAQDLDRDRARPEVARPAQPRRRRAPEHLGRGVGARAQPRDDDPAAEGVEVRDVSGLRLELLRLERGLDLAPGRAVEPREPLRQPLLLGVEADDVPHRDADPALLGHLARDRLARRLAEVDEPAGQAPLAERRGLAALDEQHAALVEDDGADADARVVRVLAAHAGPQSHASVAY